jgi:hypothetical protein
MSGKIYEIGWRTDVAEYIVEVGKLVTQLTRVEEFILCLQVWDSVGICIGTGLRKGSSELKSLPLGEYTGATKVFRIRNWELARLSHAKMNVRRSAQSFI